MATVLKSIKAWQTAEGNSLFSTITMDNNRSKKFKLQQHRFGQDTMKIFNNKNNKAPQQNARETQQLHHWPLGKTYRIHTTTKAHDSQQDTTKARTHVCIAPLQKASAEHYQNGSCNTSRVGKSIIQPVLKKEKKKRTTTKPTTKAALSLCLEGQSTS